VKIITVYIGDAGSSGFINEQRRVVTDVGELSILQVDNINLLITQNETNLLQRAADIAAPIMG